jgi:hypothetical protein
MNIFNAHKVTVFFDCRAYIPPFLSTRMTQVLKIHADKTLYENKPHETCPRITRIPANDLRSFALFFMFIIFCAGRRYAEKKQAPDRRLFPDFQF